MIPSGRSISRLIPGLLGLGVVLPLWELVSQTHGPHAVLACSVAAVVFFLGLFCAPPGGARLLSLIVSITAVLLILLSACGSQKELIGSSLAWSAVLCGLVFLGALSIMSSRQAATEACRVAEANESASFILVESPPASANRSPMDGCETAGRPGTDEEACTGAETGGEDLNEAVVQSWRRFRDAAGERLEAVLTIDFAPGQRQVYVHLPFSPLLSGMPEAFCECADEGDISAEFDVLRCYGGRLNVRRRGQAFVPLQTEISVVVLTAAAASRAA